MFKVGDKVQIMYNGPAGWPMEESPVMNLEGTTAVIKSVTKDYADNVYRLEFIEVHAKNKSKFKESQADLAWRDKHLQPIDIEEVDTMALFQ